MPLYATLQAATPSDVTANSITLHDLCHQPRYLIILIFLPFAMQYIIYAQQGGRLIVNHVDNRPEWPSMEQYALKSGYQANESWWPAGVGMWSGCDCQVADTWRKIYGVRETKERSPIHAELKGRWTRGKAWLNAVSSVQVNNTEKKLNGERGNKNVLLDFRNLLNLPPKSPPSCPLLPAKCVEEGNAPPLSGPVIFSCSHSSDYTPSEIMESGLK
ncbi:hypothetical protein B0H11DRAFT_1932631 [Mycena galericulata]|nr:hypothetical protein B0H11DRAFT_1932631 [Mycena galericulata]